ncbi:Bax inhibitor-1/YccA family protein [Streptomyces sp. NPDC057428]|uniref:Bax inhibitor-1/YccA family membrane protein n=1 Tax=Streptomyces sp. NPDC057428 TaxID=3346129 RepID=UPI0036A83D59
MLPHVRAGLLNVGYAEVGLAQGRRTHDESWTAAFGLTVTLVWLYVETLRLLTLVRDDDS